MPSELLPYQGLGVTILLRHECLLLADDMGLGKTVQTIVALRTLLQSHQIENALLIAPIGLLAQWRRELWTWAPELSVICVDGAPAERAWKWKAAKQLVLCGYETARNDESSRSRVWDLVVLDEAQKIKNRGSAVSRAIKTIPRKRAWVLTGTPLENREDELASVLEFARPNPDGRPMSGLRFGPGLRALHRELQLRRRKCDVLTELPTKQNCPVVLELGPAQKIEYERARAQGRSALQNLGASATVVNVLELISRLKQICNFCPATGQSSKLEDVKERLETIAAGGYKALIFSQWTNEQYGVHRLERELKRYLPLVYTGSLTLQERSARTELFRHSAAHKVMLLSLRAGGQGLNLQDASYVFHFDRWWNPAVENQATDRSHRMGQQHPVTVYTYTCQDTIEERIEQILEGKRLLFDMLVDSVSLDPRRLLSPGELFGLFDLPAPARKTAGQEGTPVERLHSVLRNAGWTVDAAGRAAMGDRQLRVECARREDVCPAGGGARLVLIPEQIPAHELRTLQWPGVTVWSLDELTAAEKALGLKSKKLESAGNH